jgi:hypothetical protein
VIAEPVGLTPGVADLGDLEDDPYASDYDGPVGPWSRKSRFVNIEPEIDTDDAVDAPEADDVLPPQTTTQLILNQMEDMVALQTVTNDYLGQILAETRRTRQLFERLSQHLGNPPKPPPVAPKPGAVRPGG